MLADPHYAAREALVDVDTARWGTIKMQNSFPKLSATPSSIRSPAPTIVGEHNAEIYGALLGLSEADLADARRNGRGLMDDAGSLVSSYAPSFSGHLPFGRHPALLVIDVVRAYLDPASPLYDAAFITALPVIARLVAATRAAAVPVVFTRVVYGAGGLDGGLFYRKLPVLRVFDAGSALGDFPATVAPQPNDVVITKQYASAFFGTCLASTLTGLGIDTLLLAGFSTSGCVRASALDALQHGFAPFVVSNACADRHPDPHAANLFDLQAKYAEVVGCDSAIALLNGETAAE